MSSIPTLVPGRACGSCIACCHIPMIDRPDVQKRSGVMCRNCVDGGCVIYDTRPQVCRDFHCAWRQMANLDESWRPDKSGVYMEFKQLDGVTGVTLTLIQEPWAVVRRPGFIDFVATCVIHNVPVWLGLPGPKGDQGAYHLLNVQRMREAAAASRERVGGLLELSLQRLQANNFLPYEMNHGGNDMGVDG